jgi:hypothetical protein
VEHPYKTGGKIVRSFIDVKHIGDVTDKSQHPNITEAPSLRGYDSYTDHCPILGKVAERLQ